MRFYWLAIGILAVWRITHLLQGEDGPWDLVARFRARLGRSFWSKLMDCFYCLSIWIALPATLLIGESWQEFLLLWPALSGGAVLLERVTKEPALPLFVEDQVSPTPPAEKENGDGVLRRPQEPEPSDDGGMASVRSVN